MYRIEIVCCECKKRLGWKPGGTIPDQVSHTYCEKCMEDLKRQLEKLHVGNHK